MEKFVECQVKVEIVRIGGLTVLYKGEEITPKSLNVRKGEIISVPLSLYGKHKDAFVPVETIKAAQAARDAIDSPQTTEVTSGSAMTDSVPSDGDQGEPGQGAIPEYSMDDLKSRLQALCDGYGIEYTDNTTKAQLIKLLDLKLSTEVSA